MESSTSTIGVPGKEQTARLFDVTRLLSDLGTLTDSRSKKGLRYALPIVLLFIVLAKLSGQDRPSGIADWVAQRKEQLVGALGLGYRSVPHHNTYRRILSEVVKPEELEKVSSRHLQGLAGVGWSVLISIDGKNLHGTVDLDNCRGDHLLAAYLPEEGIVLFQVEAGSKENEITVAPRLLASIDLRGKVVMGDAQHTQSKLSLQIVQAGGDYIWLVKDNQPGLREEIAELFDGEKETVLGGHIPHDFQSAKSVDKGHGRRERREITVSSELKGYSQWPGMEQVFRLERRRVDLKSGKEERKVVYGVTSLSPAKASAERLLYLTRTYWGIENGLHRRRDVTFQEDATRQTVGHAGRVMATINNLVISLLRYTGATNLAQARRKYDAVLTHSLSLLLARPIT